MYRMLRLADRRPNITVADFLIINGVGAENAALRRLLGSIADDFPRTRSVFRGSADAAVTIEGSASLSLYECVLIARNDVTQQQVEGIADGIASQLETDGGTMIKREYWGLRSLAYQIKKNRKGHYMLLGINAKPAFVTEMERQLRLNEDILRFLTLAVDGLDQAPSAILSRKADEHERNFRGPKPMSRFDTSRRRSFGDREEFRAREAPREDLAVDPALGSGQGD
jgi:small subunit ribosomal protein S6